MCFLYVILSHILVDGGGQHQHQTFFKISTYQNIIQLTPLQGVYQIVKMKFLTFPDHFSRFFSPLFKVVKPQPTLGLYQKKSTHGSGLLKYHPPLKWPDIIMVTVVPSAFITSTLTITPLYFKQKQQLKPIITSNFSCKKSRIVLISP